MSMDIRIVEHIHPQPTLFGDPILSKSYSLVDGDERPIPDKEGKPYNLPTLAKAEITMHDLMRSTWERIAREYAERGEEQS